MVVINMGSQILDEKEIQNLKTAYMSDRTTYIRGLTEIEPKRILITDSFMEKYTNQLGFVDKWTPLANFQEPKEAHLHKLKMINAQLALDNDLFDIANETLISAWDDIQVSRGNKGFFQNALNTERHEIQEERRSTDSERKVGFFNRLFGKKEEPQQPQGAPQR
jgi:hypothetical protein